MQRLQLRLTGCDNREIDGTVPAISARPLTDRVVVQIWCMNTHYFNHSFPKYRIAHPDDFDWIVTGEFDARRLSHWKTDYRKRGR